VSVFISVLLFQRQCVATTRGQTARGNWPWLGHGVYQEHPQRHSLWTAGTSNGPELYSTGESPEVSELYPIVEGFQYLKKNPSRGDWLQL